MGFGFASCSLIIDPVSEEVVETFDAQNATNTYGSTLSFTEAHGLSDGDIITYTGSSDGSQLTYTLGDDATGYTMTAGDTFTVVVVDGTTIQLLDSTGTYSVYFDTEAASAENYSFTVAESLETTLVSYLDIADSAQEVTIDLGATSVSFDSTTDISGSIITVAGHDFSQGEPVTYYSGNDDAVNGLTDGQTYYVINVDGDTFQLALTSAGTAISLSAGTVSDTQYLVSATWLDAGSGSGLSVGSMVTYSMTTSDTEIDEFLEEGQTYYVVAVNGSKVQLSSEPDGEALTLDITFEELKNATNGTESTSATTVHTLTRTGAYSEIDASADVVFVDVEAAYEAVDAGATADNTVSIADTACFYEGQSVVYDYEGVTLGTDALEVDLGTDTITWTGHGFTDGACVVLSGDSLSEIGLSAGTYYVIYTDADSFQLAATSGGTAVDLTMDGVDGEGNPITINTGTGTTSGAVTLTSNNAIAGLTSGSTYYVAAVTDTGVRLSDSSGGSVVAISFDAENSNDSHWLTSDSVFTSSQEIEDGTQVVVHTLYSDSGTTDETILEIDTGENPLDGVTVSSTVYTIRVATVGTDETGDVNYLTDSAGNTVLCYYLEDSQGNIVSLDLDASRVDTDVSVYISAAYAVSVGQDHGFEVGDTVVMDAQGAVTTLDGLTEGTVYYVVGATDTTVTLSTTEGGDPVSVDYFNTMDGLTKIEFETLSDTTFVLCATDEVDLGAAHNWNTGDVITYVSGEDDIGLTVGSAYEVTVVNDSTVIFTDTHTGDVVNLDLSRYDGSTMSFDSVRTLTASTVTTYDDTISFDTAHEFSTGDIVSYSAGDGTAIEGLSESALYYVYVVDEHTVCLAASADDLSAGNYITLDVTEATGAAHTLTLYSTDDLNSAADVISDNVIDVGYEHGLITGQAVVYDSGAGVSIGGLTDGQTYYVIVTSATSFMLAQSLDDILVDNPDLLEIGDVAGVNSFTPVQDKTASTGNITITSAGSILAYDSDSIIRGGLVTLTALGEGSTIGTELLPVTVDTAQTTADGLVAYAYSDIYITEISGSLQVQIVSSFAGDVWLEAQDGSLLDSNDTETRDEKAYEALVTLWEDMNLTGEYAQAQAQETIDAYVAMREREYQSYWTIRNTQDDPSVYDADFEVTITGSERDAYEAYYSELFLEENPDATDGEVAAYVQDAITNLATKRTDEYHTLHEVYGIIGDTCIGDWAYADSDLYEPSIELDASSDIVDAVANTIYLGAHLYATGQGVVYKTDEAATITGLVNGEIYYVVAVDSTTIQLAASQEDALAGIVIDIDIEGVTGGHTFSETDALVDGATWSEDELLYSVGGGWLLETTDTTTVIEDANVDADNITLEASDSVGARHDDVVIDLSQGFSELSDDEKVALMSSERTDLVIVDGEDDTITFGSLHGLATGDAVIVDVDLDLTHINGISDGTTYYVVVVDEYSIKLAQTLEDAQAAVLDDNYTTGIVDITSYEAIIRSNEDFDVTATGSVNITAGESIYLGSEVDIAIGQISAGGDTVIKTDGSIYDGLLDVDGDGNELANISTGSLVLEASYGTIGTAGDSLDITLNGGTLTARSEGDIYVNSVAADFLVDTIYSEAGVNLYTDDGFSILDGYDSDNTNIAAVSLNLYSGGAIGSLTNRLEIDLDSEGTLHAEARDDIGINEDSGDMNLSGVISYTGDVDLVADVSILGQGDFTSADITGGNITLTAENGSLGAALSGDLYLDTDYLDLGTGTLTATSEYNAYLHEIDGDLLLYQVASTLGTAFISSDARILNGNEDGYNVISGWVQLYAVGDIGQADNVLELIKSEDATNACLEGTSVSGSVYIHNTGHVVVGGVTSNSTGLGADGEVVMTASSPVTFASSVEADAISYTAVDDADDGDSETNDDIIIHEGVTLTAKDGDITLLAGDSIYLEEGAALQATGDIILASDYNDADTGVGTTIDLQGDVDAQSLEITTGDDDDLVVLSMSAMAIPTGITLGGGSDTLTLGSKATCHSNSGGTLAYISGLLSVDGGDGDDVLELDNTGNSAGSTGIITEDTITGFSMSEGIQYESFENIGLELGQGDDTVAVRGTALGSEFTVSGNGGNDTFTVSSRAADITGDLDPIQGSLTIDGGDGVNSLTVSDQGNTSGRSGILLTSDRLSGFNDSGAVLNYVTSGSWDNGLDFLFGQGSDVITANEIAADGTTVITLGSGDDTLTLGELDLTTDSTLVIFGGQGSDTIDGSSWQGDLILVGGVGTLQFDGDSDNQTLAGIEVKAGADGGDTLIGGQGNDLLIGGDDNDVLEGGIGEDILIGDYGEVSYSEGVVTQVETFADANSGNDTLNGEDGADLLIGGGGDDSLSGGSGDNILIGDDGKVIYAAGIVAQVETFADANSGNDTLNGEDGADLLIGGGGDDSLSGGSGDNILIGDDGKVIYAAGIVAQVETFADANSGNDTLNGEDGADLLIGGGGDDSLSGGSGDNILIGDDGKVIYAAGIAAQVETFADANSGNDTLTGEDGADLLIGGGGDDSLSGGSGDNILIGDDGKVIYAAGIAAQVETFADANSGNDTLTGEDGADLLIGGGGDDSLSGGSGDNILIGDNGKVIYTAGLVTQVETLTDSDSGDDTLISEDGEDLLIGGEGDDSLAGGSNDDVLLGDDAKVTYSNGSLSLVESSLSINGGADTLSGGSGVDLLIGGAGADTIKGGAGNDILLGDHVTVTYANGTISWLDATGIGMGGDDTLSGGGGNDVMIGGYGQDGFDGDFSKDVMIEEYATATLENGTIVKLDMDQWGRSLLTTTFLELYSTDLGSDDRSPVENTSGTTALNNQVNPAGSILIERPQGVDRTSLFEQTDLCNLDLTDEGGFLGLDGVLALHHSAGSGQEHREAPVKGAGNAQPEKEPDGTRKNQSGGVADQKQKAPADQTPKVKEDQAEMIPEAPAAEDPADQADAAPANEAPVDEKPVDERPAAPKASSADRETPAKLSLAGLAGCGWAVSQGLSMGKLSDEKRCATIDNMAASGKQYRWNGDHLTREGAFQQEWEDAIVKTSAFVRKKKVEA